MKRKRIEELDKNKEYTEVEYLRQVFRMVKDWKKEMESSNAETTAKENCRIRKNDIETVLRRKWNALDPKPELTVDELAKIFEAARTAKELPDEWMPLPSTWKRKYWGTCRFRDVGGSCDQDVCYVCAIIPFDATGGNDMNSGKDDAISLFHNDYNEAFVCEKHYKARYSLRLYKRLFFPPLIEKWKKEQFVK